jgi:hypothetical protein
MVVGLTTTELLAALIVGFDAGTDVTEITGSWVGVTEIVGSVAAGDGTAV